MTIISSNACICLYPAQVHLNAATMSCFLRFHSHSEWLVALSTREFIKIPLSSEYSPPLISPSLYNIFTEVVKGVKGLVSVQITSSSYHRCKATDVKSPNEENFNHNGNYIMRKLKSYWMKTEIWRDLASENRKVIAMKVGSNTGGSTVNSHNLMLKHLVEGRLSSDGNYVKGGAKKIGQYSSTDKMRRNRQQATKNHGRRLQASSSSVIANSSSYHYYSWESRNREYRPKSKAAINQIHMLSTKIYAMKLRLPEYICDRSVYKILSGIDEEDADATGSFNSDAGSVEPICDPNSRVSLLSERLEMEMVRIGYGHQGIHKSRSSYSSIKNTCRR